MNNIEQLFLKIRPKMEASGKPHLHKPLLVLFALGRCLNGQPRLEYFLTYDSGLKTLFARFYPKALHKSNTHYPFGRLENDRLWEIEGSATLKRTSVGHLLRGELLERNVRGGFTKEVYDALIQDNNLSYRVTQNLLSRFFDAKLHADLLQAVDLPNERAAWETLQKQETKPIYNASVNASSYFVSEPAPFNEHKSRSDLNRNYHKNEPSSSAPAVPDAKYHAIQGAVAMQQNGFIAYLNSLHNIGAAGANALAESQALNEYFSELYEPFEIVETICDVLTGDHDYMVILTGHAGDGKSTVAVDVIKQLRRLDSKEPLKVALKEIETIDHPKHAGRHIHVLKDMSELSAKIRLEKIVQGFDEPGSWLIVSNTGPLLNTLADFAEQRNALSGIESQILTYLNRPYSKDDIESHILTIFPKDTLILNMTRLDNVRLGARVLTRMINHSAWSTCSKCDAQPACPLVLNQRALKSTEGAAEQRIRWIYQRLTAYEQRLTLRQMVAQLAYAMTGGLGCKEARDMVLESTAEGIDRGTDGLEGILFSEGFFGYLKGKPSPDAEALRAVDLLRRQVFGGPVGVDYERQMLSMDSQTWAVLPKSLGPLNQRWTQRAQESAGVQWRFAQRRMLYIFGQPTQVGKQAAEIFWGTFLQSPRLRDFDHWSSQNTLTLSYAEQSRLTRSCLRVLLEIFSGFNAGQFSSDQERLYLTLRRPDRAVVQPTQFVMATVSFRDFDLAYDASRRLPMLQFRSGLVKLDLPLPLLDFIENRVTGDLGSELARIHLAQLEWFRAELLRVVGSNPDDCRIQLLRVGIDGRVHPHRYVLDKERQILEIDQ